MAAPNNPFKNSVIAFDSGRNFFIVPTDGTDPPRVGRYMKASVACTVSITGLDGVTVDLFPLTTAWEKISCLKLTNVSTTATIFAAD